MDNIVFLIKNGKFLRESYLTWNVNSCSNGDEQLLGKAKYLIGVILDLVLVIL